MVWADPRRVVEQAKAGGYAVGGFNMHNEETTQALVRAAEQAGAPVFLQVGRAIVPHMGLRRAYELTRRVAEESDAEMVIHLDHGPWDEVFEAIRLGFGSIMYDGAHLPFEENIRTTKRIVEVAHDFGIPVEAELGKIPDADQEVDWASYYTDVAEAERFVAETGVDWLAVSVGIVHGVPLSEPQPLDIARIKEIKAVTGVPLVLHGASGVPDDEIRAATDAGVRKFNADTDLRHAFRSGIEAVWAQGDRQLEDAMAEGRSRMIEATVAKMRLYGCAGRAGSAVAA
ncbi:class II fructose-bisphosphate aldolase [Quadrisphaera sp. DSM 44207]|uniref:class II fructose-bisphosphate aldolase n=1 Tax=Quadrisphaera sp. DSM 44207 TaxID=1881057 RepID=UPI00087E44ED|nr:class II fructose-bisphosphate aldolase [Quadrisphaera sp. DSM 44207]SDQ83289.1 fructose-bisphosphate aldolase, class II [Quadrisphaera sp. DSM 44207]